jgi:hypothetical protein
VRSLISPCRIPFSKSGILRHTGIGFRVLDIEQIGIGMAGINPQNPFNMRLTLIIEPFDKLIDTESHEALTPDEYGISSRRSG